MDPPRLWWIAERAWLCVGATVAAWALRLGMPMGHRPVVGDRALAIVTWLAIVTAAVATVAASLTERPAGRRRRGTGALGISLALGGVGVILALPWRRHCGYESGPMRARADLDTLRQAIILHDSQEPALTGCRLEPLVGRYLQELPPDPWGRTYLLDTSLGVLFTLGADHVPGGQDHDADIVVRYRSSLQIHRARLHGRWGAPLPGDRLAVRWTKPYVVADPEAVPRDIIVVLEGARHLGMRLGGTNVEREPPGGLAADAMGWAGVRWSYGPELSNPRQGSMVLACLADPTVRAPRPVVIQPGMAVDVTLGVVRGVGDDRRSLSAIREAIVPGGPLDPAVAGPSPVVVPDGAYPIRPDQAGHRGAAIELARPGD